MTKKIFLVAFLICCVVRGTFVRAASANEALLGSLAQTSGVTVTSDLHPRTGKLRFLKLENNAAIPVQGVQIDSAAPPEVAAMGFMKVYGSLFGITAPDKELTVRRKTRNEAGHSFVRFQQVHQGIPVFGGELVVQSGEMNGIMSVSSKAVPNLLLDVTPSISPEAAKEAALALVSKHQDKIRADLSVSEPELAIYNPIIFGPGQDASSLVWRLEVSATDLSPISELVLVDARYGFIALHFNQVPHAKNRKIYDLNNQATSAMPGTLVRYEGKPVSTISEVNYAYDYSGYTYDFYLSTHGRDSIDGAGLPIVSTVRFCQPSSACPYDNAFWSNSRSQMIYGDGFAIGKDVVGHELTHGVTAYESGLLYYMQSGAINESFSDIWGEFIDQSFPPFPSRAHRWFIGDALISIGGPFRSMSDPTQYSNPDKMSNSALYRCGGTSDNGGVHSNSGINNKAAFLLTDGGSFNGKTVTGLGMTKVAKIYYEAQTNLLVSASDYADLYNLLQQACSNLTATGVTTAADCIQVKNAVDAVEMNLDPINCAAPEAPYCTSGKPLTFLFDNFESQSGWAVDTPIGIPSWFYQTKSYASSGVSNYWGQSQTDATNSIGFLNSGFIVPANAFMHFRHAYVFQNTNDGGTVEYMRGNSWFDAGALPTINGYNGTISSSTNPLNGRNAFVNESNGYMSTRIDLSSLAGQEIFIGFRVASDSSVALGGWFIDDVRIYTCDATVPTITARYPLSTASNVPLNAIPTATFSENMNSATISNATFTLASGTTSLPGNVQYNNRVASFYPGGGGTLAPNRGYSATVTAGVADLVGNNMVSDSTWTFTTGAGAAGSCNVRLDGGLCFPTVNYAYAQASLDSVIRTTSGLASAAVTINRGVPVTLAGGYSDSNFIATGRTTTKISKLTVANGAVRVNLITIK